MAHTMHGALPWRDWCTPWAASLIRMHAQVHERAGQERGQS